jgi:glycosyltransferase involved in cell wall biosynthesis
LIVDLRDPWAIGFAKAMMDRAFPLWVTRYFERRVLPHAAAITVTTDDLAQALVKAYPILQGKIHVVRNGYDGDPRPAMRATGHRLSILFAGELYVNRNPFEFLEAVERLLARTDADPSKVEVIFIGHCESFGDIRLRDWMSGKRCDAVTQVLPPVPASELLSYIERATLLINFAQGQPWAIPAKTYEHMASGHELLVLCESDSATGRLINGIAGVSVVDPRNAIQLDNTLNDLYRRHVVEGVPRAPSDEDAAPFSRKRQSELFVSLVESVHAT